MAHLKKFVLSISPSKSDHIGNISGGHPGRQLLNILRIHHVLALIIHIEPFIDHLHTPAVLGRDVRIQKIDGRDGVLPVLGIPLLRFLGRTRQKPPHQRQHTHESDPPAKPPHRLSSFRFSPGSDCLLSALFEKGQCFGRFCIDGFTFIIKGDADIKTSLLIVLNRNQSGLTGTHPGSNFPKCAPTEHKGRGDPPLR